MQLLCLQANPHISTITYRKKKSNQKTKKFTVLKRHQKPQSAQCLPIAVEIPHRLQIAVKSFTECLDLKHDRHVGQVADGARRSKYTISEFHTQVEKTTLHGYNCHDELTL
jgi:hypothetical protein